jgi:hypothetical protein
MLGEMDFDVLFYCTLRKPHNLLQNPGFYKVRVTVTLRCRKLQFLTSMHSLFGVRMFHYFLQGLTILSKLMISELI